MATDKLTIKQTTGDALDSLGQGKDILEYLTSVTQHVDSPEAQNGLAAILIHALEHLKTAEGFFTKIHEEVAS